ncbi:hypothetical protein ACFB49_35720 [Sphingomonas sp. DBB INV C78]
MLPAAAALCAWPLEFHPGIAQPQTMDLDALLLDHFGTTDLATLNDDGLAAGLERLLVAFGTESDPGRRFGLWALLHGLGHAPDPAVAFEGRREREAAENYARLIGRAETKDD